MQSIRALRSRIKSVENTGQLSRSMKMIAAAKLRRNQEKASSQRLFARECSKMLSSYLATVTDCCNPFTYREGESKKRCYVLFVGSRGLCGTFNRSMLRYMHELADREEGEYLLVVCGRWGKENVPASGFNVLHCFENISDTPSPEETEELCSYLKGLYLEGKADEIVLVYQSHNGSKAGEPGCLTLLPAKPEGGEKLGEYIIEPDKQSVLDALSSLYISSALYTALLEAKMSEHFARMAAMTAAADNTEQLVKELTLELNHARQEAITTEITELVNSSTADIG